MEINGYLRGLSHLRCLLSFVLIKAVTDKIESDLHQIEPKIALTNGALSFGEALLSESKKMSEV